MSTQLVAISSHDLHFDFPLQILSEEVIKEIKALQLPIMQYEDFNTGQTKEVENRFEVDFQYERQDGLIDIYISTPHAISPQILPYTVIYNIVYKYWDMCNPVEWWNEFRDELYRVMRIFRSEEVIYLPDNGHPFEKFYDVDLYEGLRFEEVKEKMTQMYGHPVTEYEEEINLKLYQNHEIMWRLDDFRDLKYKYGPAPKLDIYNGWV